MSKQEQDKVGSFIEEYLQKSKKIALIVFVIDIRHEPSANDKQMYDWVVYQGYDPIIIATKSDKIKRSQLQKHMKMIREGLKVKAGTPILPYSAQTKQGREEIWNLIDELLGFETTIESNMENQKKSSVQGE